MSAASDFKKCALQTGAGLGFSNGRVIRDFGLKDFLDNLSVDPDDTVEIAIAALEYFCKGSGPKQDVFKFAVLAVSMFLHQFHTRHRGCPPAQTMIDLVTLLTASASSDQLRQWVVSHF